MKQVLAGLFLFILGVAVGTTGSDDSLLEIARQREATAFERGQAAATAKMQAIAVQTGSGKWVVNPNTGQTDCFIWKVQDRPNADPPDSVANGSSFFTEPPWDAPQPDGV